MKICHNTFIGHLVGRAPVGSKSDEDRSSRLCRRSGFVVAKVQAGLGTVLCKSEIRNPKSEFRTKPDLTGTGFGFRFSGFSRFSGFGIRVSPASGRGGFTMVEIAICLAIIGFALIAIIGALPIGMNTQRDNREETLINQDATVLLEAIRGGARGLDNLTNYVYAITNNWGVWSAGGVLLAENVTGYTYAGSTVSINGSPFVPTTPQIPLTNGLNIIGLLSTPEYTIESSGRLIPSLYIGGVSNHVVAYVHSISGPVVEKPPQDNVIVRDGSFGYRVLCVNAPMATDPNIFSQYPIWQLTTAYPMGARVIDNWTWWVALTYTSAGDRPGVSPKWRPDGDFNLGTTQILHELRLAFFWPQLPNGSLGPGHQSFRTLVAGQVAQIGANSPWLYFYQPQSFDNVTNAP